MKMIKYGILLGMLTIPLVVQAKTATMVWFLRPNVAVQRTISAISPNLSAKCVSNINTGKVVLSINGQKRILTPGNIRSSFANIVGTAHLDGKYSYSYSIFWEAPSKVMCVFSLTCEGDNHRVS